jgi:hypothetical protein
MVRRAVMAMVPPRVRHEHPLHPASHVAVSMGSDHQVKVVGHQAVAQDVHRQTGLRIDHRFNERIVIRRLRENGLAAVAPIQNVIPRLSDRCSCGPGRAQILQRIVHCRNICYVPFFMSPFLVVPFPVLVPKPCLEVHRVPGYDA